MKAPLGRMATFNSRHAGAALVQAWLRRMATFNRLAAVFLAVLAGLSGLVTYLTLTGDTPFIDSEQRNVRILLILDLVLLVLLAGLIGRRVVLLRRDLARQERRRLRVRFLVMFTGVALGPALVIGAISILLLDHALQSWFAERYLNALRHSRTVAEAYLEEHRQRLVTDARGMAGDLARGGPALFADIRRLENLLDIQARVRVLSDAQVLEADGRVLARSAFSSVAAFAPPPGWAYNQVVETGDVAIIVADDDGQRLGALLLVPGFSGVFLYIGRFVDPVVVRKVVEVRRSEADFARAADQREGIQLTVAMIYVAVAALFLLLAMWIGLNLATSVAAPVTALIGAANRVSRGDLAARVATEEGRADEIGLLGRAFNRMAAQLVRQRDALVEANRELDERHRFTEAVLAGVAVGVISLDGEGRVHLSNGHAGELLGMDIDGHAGEPFDALAHPFSEALDEARRRGPAWDGAAAETEIAFERDGEPRTLLLRITARTAGGVPEGHVLTFTDVTARLAAERQAAWADIARRIAHEIKNPLTPIQLSAERLARRYLGQISEDPETFRACVDVIVAQVETMRGMVDEFSDFARMPAPVPAVVDLAEVVRQTALLQAGTVEGVAIETDLPDGPAPVSCDRGQVGRALSNLVLNAQQALEGGGGTVRISLEAAAGEVRLAVEDDGPGFPPGLRDRLTEPYVAGEKSRGSGLGLAIVRKIVEDHGASIRFEDAATGARVRIVFRTADGPEPEREPG